MAESKVIKSPAEMVELIDKVIKEAKDKQGIDIDGVQAQQIIAKGYKTK